MSELNSVQFWEDKYLEKNDGWEQGEAAPPLVKWLANNSPVAQVIVPGCGRGHEARAFAEHAQYVLGVDFAPSAIREAKRITSECENVRANIDFLEADIFALEDKFQAKFDLWVEHTTFCAIAPERRNDYLSTVERVLKPEGRILGLFWNHGKDGGPPFDISLETVRDAFSDFEIIETIKANNSFASRQGKEFLALLHKKPR